MTVSGDGFNIRRRVLLAGAVVVGGLLAASTCHAAQGWCSETGDTCVSIEGTRSNVTVRESYPERMDGTRDVCVMSPTGRRCIVRPGVRVSWGGTEWRATWRNARRGLWWLHDGMKPAGAIWIGATSNPASRPKIALLRGALAGPGEVVYLTARVCNPTAQTRRYYVESIGFTPAKKRVGSTARFLSIKARRCTGVNITVPGTGDFSYGIRSRLTMIMRDVKSGQVAVRTAAGLIST